MRKNNFLTFLRKLNMNIYFRLICIVILLGSQNRLEQGGTMVGNTGIDEFLVVPSWVSHINRSCSRSLTVFGKQSTNGIPLHQKFSTNTTTFLFKEMWSYFFMPNASHTLLFWIISSRFLIATCMVYKYVNICNRHHQSFTYNFFFSFYLAYLCVNANIK